MSDTPQGEGWWLASDGKYYPPAQPAAESAPDGSEPQEPQETQGRTDPTEEGSGKAKIIAVLAVLLLVAAGVVAFLVLGGDDDSDSSDKATADGSAGETDIGDATGELVDGGPVSFDTDYEDSLEGTRTEARYTLDAPDSAIMTLTVMNEDASERGVFASLQSNGETAVGFRTLPGATQSEELVLASNGGIKFDLIFTEGPAAFSFRIDLEIPSDAGQEGDAGGDFDTAFVVDAGQEVAGSLAGRDTLDYYTLELQPGTEFSMLSTVERGSERGVFFSVELDGERIHTVRVQPGAEDEFAVLLSDEDEGTLEIITAEGPGNYTFTADFKEEDEGGAAGDAPAELANARMIDASEPLTGQIGGRDAGDFYTFEAPSGTVTITGEADATSERGFFIAIQNESGNAVGSFRTQPGAKAEEVFEVEAGSTLRIIVTEGPAAYTITIS